MTVSQIRRVMGDRIASRLLRLMKLTRVSTERLCPFCRKSMKAISTQEPLLQLEACRDCGLVWFDLPTYTSLPQLTAETTNSIPLQATEIIAMDRLKELKKRQEEERKQAEKKKRLHRIMGIKSDEK